MELRLNYTTSEGIIQWDALHRRRYAYRSCSGVSPSFPLTLRMCRVTAIYARVSSERQAQEGTIESGVAALRGPKGLVKGRYDGPAAAPSPEETVQREPLRLPGMAWLTVVFILWIVHWVTMDIPGVGPGVIWWLPFLLGALFWGYWRLFARPTWMETGSPLYFGLGGTGNPSGESFLHLWLRLPRRQTCAQSPHP